MREAWTQSELKFGKFGADQERKQEPFDPNRKYKGNTSSYWMELFSFTS